MHGLPIETSTLRLRHLVVDDAARIMALNAEPSTSRWLPSHVYESPDGAVNAIRYLVGCYTVPGDPHHAPYVLALELRATHELLGHVGFSPLNADVEISYAIAEATRGHGHATAAVVCACKWLAGRFGVRSVLALTASANTPSRRLLERAAFVHLRDETRRFQGSEQSVSHYRLDTTRTGVGA